MTVCNDSVFTLKADYFVFFSWKWNVWNKWAENGSCREPLSTSMQPGGWIECAGMRGDRIPWWGGADDKATQQSPSKLLNGKTWRSKHQSPSLLDLARAFTGIGGREERTFAKEPSYAGCGDGELCVSHTREPLQPNSLAGGKWEDGKGTAHLGTDSQHCVPLGRNEPRGSNLLHPALLK